MTIEHRGAAGPYTQYDHLPGLHATETGLPLLHPYATVAAGRYCVIGGPQRTDPVRTGNFAALGHGRRRGPGQLNLAPELQPLLAVDENIGTSPPVGRARFEFSGVSRAFGGLRDAVFKSPVPRALWCCGVSSARAVVDSDGPALPQPQKHPLWAARILLSAFQTLQVAFDGLAVERLPQEPVFPDIEIQLGEVDRPEHLVEHTVRHTSYATASH
ncbi:DUF6420 family protein [Streptomyces platensis]|uniref:DUF6420 family protein n=1 Tax=Streptomyces platensis TaxID=58346 RepID=UPI0030E4D4F0